MSTFEMNNNNDNGANEFWYDKNEFYAENGLAKAQKKDRKSYSKKALQQAEERQKKQDEYISHLPGKMQKLLLEAKTIKAVKAYKATKEDADQGKSGKIYKHFVNPVKNTSQNVFYNDDEDYEEEYYDKEALRDEAYSRGLDMYQRYGLTKEQYDADLEHQETIEELAEYNANPENYHAPPDYGRIIEERIRKAKEYTEGLNMWERYGLTKQQYDADLEYREYIAALDYYNQDPENYLAPQYRVMLETAIKKYEDEMAAKQKAEEEALQDVNWYNPDELHYIFEDWSSSSYPVENEESLEDFAERMREQDMEFAMENARDDMRDDY